jgi:hypothetical protein
MGYNFIETKYPVRDPNIDINFNNDILYKALDGDDTVDKYNIKHESPNKNTNYVKQSRHSDYSIYIYFIIVVIFLVLIWYYYGSSKNIKQKNIIDTYPDQPELTMLSPDMGMDIRYGRI